MKKARKEIIPLPYRAYYFTVLALTLCGLAVSGYLAFSHYLNYTDIAFAAFTGLWLMPPAYGGGRADGVRIERDIAPPGMRDDIERWKGAYARAVQYAQDLYERRGEQV